MRNIVYPRPLRRHRWDPRRPLAPLPAPPGPAVVHVRVARLGENRYCWYFDQPYDDSGAGGWIPDDFAGLTIDGTTPDGIDEAIGAEGAITLHYFLYYADTFHVVETPAVLRFANGATILLPDSGPVGT